MDTQIKKTTNTYSQNIEDSRPDKKEMSLTMIGAVVLAIGFGALGLWWFTN